MSDGAVKLASVVVSFLTELHEIFTGFWRVVAMELKVQWANIGDQPNITFLLDSSITDYIVLENSSFVHSLPSHGCGGERCGNLACGVARSIELVRLGFHHLFLLRLNIGGIKLLEGFLCFIV